MNEQSHKFSNAVCSHLVLMIPWSVISVFLEPLFFFTIVRKTFFFLRSWSNNQLSCGILRKIFMMLAGDYDRIINYHWPYLHLHRDSTIELHMDFSVNASLHLFSAWWTWLNIQIIILPFTFTLQLTWMQRLILSSMLKIKFAYFLFQSLFLGLANSS